MGNNDGLYLVAGSSWRRKWQPTPVLLPKEFCGQRSLVGCCPWGCTELDMTEATQHACMHWRRKWQPTPVFLPGESQGQRSLVGCRLWGRTESDMTEATQQQQAVVKGKSGWIQERTGYKGFYLIRNIYELEIQIWKFLQYTPLLMPWEQIRWYKAYTEKKGDLGQKLQEHCHIRVD